MANDAHTATALAALFADSHQAHAASLPMLLLWMQQHGQAVSLEWSDTHNRWEAVWRLRGMGFAGTAEEPLRACWICLAAARRRLAPGE